MITDQLGSLVQHVEYVPFGEIFVEERASASSWQTPYLFNAKELDDETGLYYYGARYYDPRTSVWLSVDPLAEKKLWMSSYVYCSNNPTNRVDPDGRDDTFDRKGENRQHIDNGTDNILIRDGENLNNITSYDYSEGQTDNRNMLSNVGTYYANEVGIEQRIGVYDLKPTEPREAFAATDPNSRQVLMAVFNGKLHQDAGNANNLKNGFVHEGVHKKDGKGGPEAELKAIHAQTSHPSWIKTTDNFKNGAKMYTVKKVNEYLQNPIVPESNVPYLNSINGNFTGTGVVIYNREAIICLPDLDVVGKK